MTDPNGSFVIDDLPAGTYHIKAWHPALGSQERDVTVGPNGVAALEFLFEAR